MDFSHVNKRARYHHPDETVADSSLLYQPNTMFAFMNQHTDMDFSHDGPRIANPTTQVQGDQYAQRGFYAATPSHAPGGMPNSAQPHHARLNSAYQDYLPFFEVQVPGMALGAGAQGASRVTGQYGHAPSLYQSQEGYYQPFHQPSIRKRERDEDNESVATGTTDCDSHCGLADPCTQEECADRPDACTDRQCPEKDCPDTNCPEKMPAEVVVAAATLAAFGGFDPPQQPSHDMSQRDGGHGLYSAQPGLFEEPFEMDASFSAFDVVKHIGLAHTNMAESNCTTNCPIYDPEIFQHFQHCPLPNSFNFGLSNFSDLNNPFANNYGNHGDFDLPFNSHEGCGAEIPNPEALVEHLNTQHRQVFQNVLAQTRGYGSSVMPQIPSARAFSSSSSNALETTLSSAAQSPIQQPFPPTPLSLSHDEQSKSPCHASLPGTVSSLENGEWERQQCLWCNPATGQPCMLYFDNSEALFAHVNGEHIQKLEKGGEGFLCHWENCKRRGDGKHGFPQRSKIERHMHTHIGRKPFECRTCGLRFSAQQALTQHLLIHSNEKPLRCDWEGCGKTFRQQSALTMHRRIHTGDKPLKCPVCGKAFSESSNLSKHKRIHEGKGRYQCSEPGCNKSFHRLDQLRRHKKAHPGVEERTAARVREQRQAFADKMDEFMDVEATAED